MITFGLTGGIASGKSTATKTFRKHNIPIVDADIVARQVVEPGTAGYDALLQEFGPEYFTDGLLNRTKLGQFVFANPEALSKLNKLMGDLINQESDKQIKQFHDDGNPIVGYDAALLIEMGNSKKYRPLIVVHCPLPTQLERLMSRNSLTEAEAMSRIKAQMTADEKIKLSDFTIDTSGPVEESIRQTEEIIVHLKKMIKEE